MCSLVDSYAGYSVLNFKSFVHDLTLVTSDAQGNQYYIQLCGTASPSPPKGCDQLNTGVCKVPATGNNLTVVYANHTFSLVSHSPRVIDVVFHSGMECNPSQNRNWTANIQMICSSQGETPVPVLDSDRECELRFVWRNRSFCAGESAAGGCVAMDTANNYMYSLDGLLSQNWTVSLCTQVEGGER